MNVLTLIMDLLVEMRLKPRFIGPNILALILVLLINVLKIKVIRIAVIVRRSPVNFGFLLKDPSSSEEEYQNLFKTGFLF
jgi:hypothetical protein